MQALSSIKRIPAATTTASLLNKYKTVTSDASLFMLEKAIKDTGGQVTLQDITKALDEYVRLFKAGIASDAEVLTLARAFPRDRRFAKAAAGIGEDELMVVGGPASIEMIDREGHLITTVALTKAFDKYMENFRTRNAMVLHSDVQVGWALPAYINKAGQIFKSGPTNNGLYFITEVRKDTKVSERVREQIDGGKLRSYSIAGTALKVQNMQKGMLPYMQVDEMELAEVTVCEKGVNQGAAFDILKAELPQTGKISKEQCGYRSATPAEIASNIMCGSCTYFNKEDGTCDTVVGKFLETDYCNLYEPENEDVDTMATDGTGESSMEITISLSDDTFISKFLSSLKKEGGEKLTREEGDRLVDRLGSTSSAFNPDNPEGEEPSIFDEWEPNLENKGRTGTEENPIPDPRKMTKALAEWSSEWQIQATLDASNPIVDHDWGAAGLQQDSNISNLKNFVRENNNEEIE